MSLRGRHGPHTRPGRALRRLLAGVCCAALIAPGAALGAQSPSTYPSSAPGAPCAGSGASAQNQYCEDIPGAGGSQTPGSGTPSLGSTLPAPARARLLAAGTRRGGGGAGVSASGATSAPTTHAAARRRKRAAINAVLNLPGAPRWSLGSGPASSVSAIAPYTWLIALLAALGLGAGVIGALRHRRTPTT